MRAVKASRRAVNSQSKLNRLAAELLEEENVNNDDVMATVEPSLIKTCRNIKRNKASSAKVADDVNLSNWKLTVISCGNNVFGQCAPDGSYCDLNAYFTVAPVFDKTPEKIFAGNNLSAAISEEGRAYVWGSGLPNAQGGKLSRELSLHSVRFISCGLQHIACINNQCEVYTWGVDEAGCLGHGQLGNLSSPQRVEYFQRIAVINVSCGGYHTAFVGLEGQDTLYGDVYTCGQGKGGQLGLGEETLEISLPTRIFSFHSLGYKISKVSCGLHHTLALATNVHQNAKTFGSHSHHVFAFGFGEFGRLGCDDDSPHFSPVEVPFERGFNPIFIGAGESHSVACSAEACYTWGNNEMSQLGNGMSPQLLPFSGTPVRTAIPEHLRIVKLAVGSRHSGVVTKCGRVLTWGWGEEGQCGSGGETNSTLPRPCKLPRIKGSELIPLDLALGMTHSLLLVRNKTHVTNAPANVRTEAKVPKAAMKSPTLLDPTVVMEHLLLTVAQESVQEEVLSVIDEFESEIIFKQLVTEEIHILALNVYTSSSEDGIPHEELLKPVERPIIDLRDILHQRESRYPNAPCIFQLTKCRVEMIHQLAPPITRALSPEPIEPISPKISTLTSVLSLHSEESIHDFPTDHQDRKQNTKSYNERRHVLKTFDVYYKEGQDLNQEGLLIAHAARRVIAYIMQLNCLICHRLN